MKTMCVAGLVMFCAASIWAGIGETKEEAIKRYGEPTKWERDAPYPGRGLTIANYSKENPPYKVYFYDNKASKSISGAIVYELPQDKKLREPLIKKFLDANSDGKSWTATKGTDTKQESYTRDGAKASFFNENWLSISLTDFDVYVSAANKRIADKQAADRQAAAKQAADKLAADKQAADRQAAAAQAAERQAAAKKATGRR